MKTQTATIAALIISFGWGIPVQADDHSSQPGQYGRLDAQAVNEQSERMKAGHLTVNDLHAFAATGHTDSLQVSPSTIIPRIKPQRPVGKVRLEAVIDPTSK
jgi:hypothetical protein